MHVLNLPAQIRDQLNMPATGPIKVVVKLKTKILPQVGSQSNGSPIFGANYVPVLWDVSDRIEAKRPVTISRSKPVLPIDGDSSIIKAGAVAIYLNNADGNFSLASLDAIIKEQGWENSEVEIFADINGQLWPMYRGDVYARPEETNSYTKMEVRNSLWQLAQARVTFEKFGPDQKTLVVGSNGGGSGALIHTTRVEGGVEFYDAVAVFIQDATVGTSVSNQNQSDISFDWIEVFNEAKLGMYKIKFTSGTDYTLTYPDNKIFQGDISTTLITDYVAIPAGFINLSFGFWSVPANFYGLDVVYHNGVQYVCTLSHASSPSTEPGVGSNWSSYWSVNTQNNSDLLGKEIEFYVYKTVEGHPIDIILNELEKAYTNDYGNAPTRPASLPIDYASFDAARQYFAGFRVYASETNKDNKVWLNLPKHKPLNALQYCQKVADHIGSQLVVDNYGQISIRTPGNDVETIQELNDDEHIIHHRILPTVASNWFKFQYGWNDDSESFADFIIEDERENSTDDKNQLILNFPYYKQDVSEYEMKKISTYYMDRYLRGLTRVEIRLKPNFALTMMPGDKVKLVCRTLPRLDATFEVYQANIEIGGEGLLKLVRIPEPSTITTTWCTAIVCESTIC